MATEQEYFHTQRLPQRTAKHRSIKWLLMHKYCLAFDSELSSQTKKRRSYSDINVEDIKELVRYSCASPENNFQIYQYFLLLISGYINFE
jgi:hypothetical protein